MDNKPRRISSPIGVIRPPPSQPKGENFDLKSWLAGCALANQSLMKDCRTPSEAAMKAVKTAEKMLTALRTSSTPVIGIPTEKEMQHWEEQMSKAKGEDDIDTIVATPNSKRKSQEMNTVSPMVPSQKRTITQKFPKETPEPKISTSASQAFRAAVKKLSSPSLSRLDSVPVQKKPVDPRAGRYSMVPAKSPYDDE